MFNFNELLGSNVSLFRNQNRTCISQLLHAMCEVHVCAGGIIGLVNSVLYGLNNYLAGMNANSDLQIRIAEASYPILHRQGCEAGANGVIFMGLRCTEQSHDPIALRFVDDALVAHDGFIHEVENRLQTPHPQFWIAHTVNDASRVANVRK